MRRVQMNMRLAYKFVIMQTVIKKLATAPVVKTEAVTGETAYFTWEAVPEAKGYLVSRNYIDFTTPSSGAGGLSHLITGLKGGVR